MKTNRYNYKELKKQDIKDRRRTPIKPKLGFHSVLHSAYFTIGDGMQRYQLRERAGYLNDYIVNLLDNNGITLVGFAIPKGKTIEIKVRMNGLDWHTKISIKQITCYQ